MKKIFLSCCSACLLFTTVLQAQAPKFEWVRPIVSNYAIDDPGVETYDFRADQSGNTYLYGNLYGDKLDFGGSVKLTNTNDAGTMFLAKIKPNGTADWIRTIVASEDFTGFTFGNYAPGLEVDNSGNVFISGTVQSDTLYFGNNITHARLCNDCEQIFVARYNPEGVPQWVSVVAGNDSTKQQGAKLALSGNSLYLTGNCEGPALDFGGGVSFSNLESQGFFLAKLNASDGKGEWAKFLNPESFYSRGYQVKAASNGDVWVSGVYSDTPIDFGNNITLDVYGEAFRSNYFLAKYSATGTPLSAVNLHSTDYLDILDIDVDQQFGGVYLVCDYSDTLRSGNLTLTQMDEDVSGGSVLYYINNTMAVALDVPYIGDGYAVSAVTAAADGDFYVSGFFDQDELLIGDTLITNEGCFDSYLLRSNLSSGRTWLRGIGGAGCEAIITAYYGQVMDLDAQGNLYVSGAYIVGMQIDGTAKLGSGLLVGKIKAETVSTQDPAVASLDFTITPNPTSGIFQVNLGEMSNSNGWLVIHDMQGREVYTQTVTTSPVEINQSLATGAYTVSFFTENQVIRKKLVVQ